MKSIIDNTFPCKLPFFFKPLQVCCRRLGIWHVQESGYASCSGCHAAGKKILLMRQSRLAEMHMPVYKPGYYYLVLGINGIVSFYLLACNFCYLVFFDEDIFFSQKPVLVHFSVFYQEGHFSCSQSLLFLLTLHCSSCNAFRQWTACL